MTTEKNTERLHLMVTPTLREDLAQAAGYLRISEAALIRDILRESEWLKTCARAGRQNRPALDGGDRAQGLRLLGARYDKLAADSPESSGVITL